MVDARVVHTPKEVLAKNFGFDPKVFNKIPSKDPYIPNGTVNSDTSKEPLGTLKGKSSNVCHTYDHPSEPVPGHGGTFRRIDSINVPISKTLAAALVELEPKGLRELHWHPYAKEWLYFHQGNARATVFTDDSGARIFDFTSGETAVFPDKSG